MNIINNQHHKAIFGKPDSQINIVQKQIPPQMQLNTQMANIIRQSTRRSYIMKYIPQNIKSKIEDQPLDSNSMRLKSAPIVDQRIYAKKQGYLQLNQLNNMCCFNLGRKDFQRRCILDKNVLQVQKSQNQFVYISFDCLYVQLAKGKNHFQIVIPSKTQSNLFFTAKTPQQAQDWIRAIQQSINTSYGKLYKLEKILYQPEFQKFDHIIEQQFKRQCNSGDIILFQDSHTFAKVQRAVTFSEYDHVGIILKNRRDEVVILQSSSNNGVAFTFWRQLIRYKWYDSIPRITWRKLNIQRNNKDINIMEEFIINNLNKQYGLNFEKLLKFKSKINKTAEEQKNRTYFCSQLVAALYKKLGLIQQQQSTTQFWPVHFSDSKKLKLLRGNLQHQRIIVFQNSLLSKQNKKK